MEKTMYKAPKNGSHFDGEQPMLNSKGQPMRRVFVEWTERTADAELECRSQIWRCPETGEECRDDWQIHCHNKAVEMAAMSDSPVLFYHTCAWRTDLRDWKVGFFVMGKPLYKVVRAETAEDAKRLVAMQIVDTLRFHSAEPYTPPDTGVEDMMERIFPGFKFKK